MTSKPMISVPIKSSGGISFPQAESACMLSRILFLTGEITMQTPSDLLKKIIPLYQDNRETITVILDSNGGCLEASRQIRQILRAFNARVVAIHAASCAALILADAKERYIMRGGTVSLHKPYLMLSSEQPSRSDAIKKLLVQLKDAEEQVYTVLQAATGKTRNEIEPWLGDELVTLKDEEACSEGLADRVIEMEDFVEWLK